MLDREPRRSSAVPVSQPSDRPGSATDDGEAQLRVLHVLEAFGGGVLEVVRTLANDQAAGGDAVAVAYGRRPESPASPRSCFAAPVELQALRWEARTARAQASAVRELRSFARAWRPDVVHLHSSFAGVVGAIAIGHSAPSVYTPHGYSFTMRDQSRVRSAAYRMLERFTAGRVDLIGAVSEAEARDARRIAPAEKIVVVRNGIPDLDDPRPTPPRRNDAERPRAIAVGRMDEARRPESTARILAGVSDIADVAWIGGGGRGGVAESVVTSRGVRVTGWLDHERALAEIRSATACLHWAAWDGQPLSVLEAMANDVVVVASDIEATREILGPRQVCRSEAEAQQLLREVLTDPALRDELLAVQRSRGASFGARRMASEWRSVYRRIAAPAGNAPGFHPSAVDVALSDHHR